MRFDSTSVRNGMFVMGTKGERIGKVIRCDPETFVVEKGVFFPKDYELRYDYIVDAKDGTIVYSLSDLLERERQREIPTEKRAATGGIAASAATAASAVTDRTRAQQEAERARFREAESARAGEAAAARPREAERPRAVTETRAAAEGEELRIPLMEETIGLEKVTKESGHVRIHKTIKTEERRFSVPVSHEEVVVEHVAASRDTSAMPGEPAFQEQTVDVTLHEEEVHVSKRPMLREEVVVRTVSRSEDREGSTTLRHEEAEVEDTRKRAPGGAETERYTGPGKR
jgi:uncharacterized protein (TIGR02271 family)